MADFLCKLADLPEAQATLVRVKDRGVAVVRLGREVFALDAVCPHWAGPLGEGRVSAERQEITCPWHRFRFGLRDGRCVAATNRPAVETFAVRIEGGDVFADVTRKRGGDA